MLREKMMHPIKYIWAISALLYKPFFKKIGILSYIGNPCFIEGRRISIGNRTRVFPGIRMEAIGTGEISIGIIVLLAQILLCVDRFRITVLLLVFRIV
jgi:hypothetical protein